jgi:hypothetical protein
VPYLPVDPANLFYYMGSFLPSSAQPFLTHSFSHTHARTLSIPPPHTNTHTHTHTHRHARFWPPYYAHRPQDAARDIRHALYVHYRPSFTTLEPPRFENSSAYAISNCFFFYYFSLFLFISFLSCFFFYHSIWRYFPSHLLSVFSIPMHTNFILTYIILYHNVLPYITYRILLLHLISSHLISYHLFYSSFMIFDHFYM